MPALQIPLSARPAISTACGGSARQCRRQCAARRPADSLQTRAVAHAALRQPITACPPAPAFTVRSAHLAVRQQIPGVHSSFAKLTQHSPTRPACAQAPDLASKAKEALPSPSTPPPTPQVCTLSHAAICQALGSRALCEASRSASAAVLPGVTACCAPRSDLL